MSKEIVSLETNTELSKNESNVNFLLDEKLENELRLINEKFNTPDNKVMQVLRDNQTVSFLKIKNLVNAGLSTLNNDFYIYPMGNDINIVPSYMGLVKVAINEALKRGYEVIVKSDTLPQNAKITLLTENEIDSLSISKNPLDNSINGAYALISIIKNGNLLYRKAEILNKEQLEIIKGKTFSKGGVYKEFPEEMARKSAIRRAIKHINYFIKSDVLDNLISLDNENYDFSNKNLNALESKKNQIQNKANELKQDKESLMIKLENLGLKKDEMREFASFTKLDENRIKDFLNDDELLENALKGFLENKSA
ncbi:recombinase RecT [Campylobacter sp. CCS1377]|uniref:Recombinase RecT n=1 Tax=Campylobacter sp. CCS1377 TaxID=3158229 RepID=A0AAU7E3H5_9BACT